jgi:signal transduction histidine kinase
MTNDEKSREPLRAEVAWLRGLVRYLLAAHEEERRRLARELREEVGQMMTGLKLLLETSGSLPEEALRQQVEAALRLVIDLTARMRDLALDLRPSMLDDLGLRPALVWLCERFTAQTQVRVVLQQQSPDGRLTAEMETAVYRTLEAALDNVARHAGATEVIVRVAGSATGLTLQVEDHGCGFDPAATGIATGGGLRTMQLRVVGFGGTLDVTAAPGAGTRITAEFPLRPPPEETPDARDPPAGG